MIINQPKKMGIIEMVIAILKRILRLNSSKRLHKPIQMRIMTLKTRRCKLE